MTAGSRPRLTRYSHGAGCACKLGPAELTAVLGQVAPARHPDLLVGNDTGDDAAVWRRPDGRALVATTDFFTPIVDDARTWGMVAAANAASDVYAMGGTPLFALNLVAWPREQLPLDLLQDVLVGAAEVAATGGWALIGGHTIDGAEPLYGQAVVGEVDESAMLTNAGARAGHVLVLTKAIGTGLVATAVKRSEDGVTSGEAPLADAYQAAVESMTRLNDEASRVALEAGASGATDVTGFGLLGHLHRMAGASGVTATVDAGSVPVLPGAWDLLDGEFVSGGTQRNLDYVRPHVTTTGGVGERELVMLADAQTSGGLLFACPADRAAEAVDRLRSSGHPAAVVGDVSEGRPGAVTVR